MKTKKMIICELIVEFIRTAVLFIGFVCVAIIIVCIIAPALESIGVLP